MTYLIAFIAIAHAALALLLAYWLRAARRQITALEAARRRAYAAGYDDATTIINRRRDAETMCSGKKQFVAGWNAAAEVINAHQEN